MTKSSLKEELARLEHDPGIAPVQCGSPVDLIIRRGHDWPAIKTIFAIRALVRRQMSLLKAKRAIEAAVSDGEAIAHVPVVENADTLIEELKSNGFIALRMGSTIVDVRQLRSGLGLTQEQFAIRFGLDIDALQNWEQGRCQPDKATRSYLRVIARAPEIAAAAQEEVVT